MNVIEADNRTPALIEQLLTIWESAVRQTHTFLPESEIERIKAYIPEAVCKVSHLLVEVLP